MMLDQSMKKLEQSRDIRALGAEWNLCARAFNRLQDDADAFEEEGKSVALDEDKPDLGSG